MFDGELTRKKWDENDSERCADGDDYHILLNWRGVIIKCYEERKF